MLLRITIFSIGKSPLDRLTPAFSNSPPNQVKSSQTVLDETATAGSEMRVTGKKTRVCGVVRVWAAKAGCSPHREHAAQRSRSR